MLLRLCSVYTESLIADSISASNLLPLLIPFVITDLSFAGRVYGPGGFHFCFTSPQTPFIQMSYKEPPYPAKTNSIEEVETNAFVLEIYLVAASLGAFAVLGLK